MNTHLKLAYDYGVQQALAEAGIKTSNFLTPKEDLNPLETYGAGLASGGLLGYLGGDLSGATRQYKYDQNEMGEKMRQMSQMHSEELDSVRDRAKATEQKLKSVQAPKTVDEMVEILTGRRASPYAREGHTLQEIEDFMRKAERPKTDVVMDALVGGVEDVVESKKDLGGKLLKRLGSVI